MEGIKTRARLAYRSIGLVLALILGIYVVFQIPHIVLLFLLTLLFAIVISGLVNYLAQMGLPRGLGVFVVLVSPALALWLASRMIIPVIETQASQFVRKFPALLTQVQDLVWSSQNTFGLESGTRMDSQSLRWPEIVWAYPHRASISSSFAR